MADNDYIQKIKVNGTSYDLVDQDAQQKITGIQTTITTLEDRVKKETVNVTKTVNVTGNTQYFITSSNISLTLSYDSEQCAFVNIFAITNCTIIYYTDSSTTESLNMAAGTSVHLIYYNGWKCDRVYGAVWN